QTEDDIEDFFAALNITSTETNKIIPKQQEQTAENRLLTCFLDYIKTLSIDFPPTFDLAFHARQCYNEVYAVSDSTIKTDPDKEILTWLNAEYQLFKTIENDRYSTRIQTPFASVEELVESANTMLNRRKSRSGKSLEHRLSEVFSTFCLTYETQAVTEGNKKPDFLFPGKAAYHNTAYNP